MICRVLLLLLPVLCLGMAGGAAAEGRWALVVGVSRYTGLRPLPNAADDARAVARVLNQVGFQTRLLLDPTTAALRAAVAGAEQAVPGSPAALFYYAGHAVQFENRNYLLGADAQPSIADMQELEDQGMDLSDVTGRLAQAALRLVFMDACRDSPLTLRPGGYRPGLASMSAGTDTTLVFAAASGQAAQDGMDGHSPFTRAMLDHLATPGLELSQLIRRVAADVLERTAGRQAIEPRDNRQADFYFVPVGVGVPLADARPPVKPADAPRPAGAVSAMLDRLKPAVGPRRLFGLEDALATAPLQRGLDAGQALAIMGDIPAPALRRRALGLLLPSLLAPIAEPEAVRLLDGFDQAARGTTIELLLPCLALPLNEAESGRLLGDTPPPLRASLARSLQRPADRAACPALKT